MRFYDAHNHLQDDRLGGARDLVVDACRAAGVAAMVVNGSCAADWPDVIELARRHPGLVRPSLGWHPWYLHERGPRWEAQLESALDAHPGAVVGEIGIDRWILGQTRESLGRWMPGGEAVSPAPIEEQEAAFSAQVRVAVRRGLPFSVHCLQAWGRLERLLAGLGPFPRGFLLHSYGGPVEMVAAFARLGAYFGFPGYYLHERKRAQFEAFRSVPPDRLLMETDAPDQAPPAECLRHPLAGSGPGGRPLNHPANLPAIQTAFAMRMGIDPETLAEQLEENFGRLFGP